MTGQAQVLIGGIATGKALRLDAPLSFWGGVDPRTSRVTLAGHPQLGKTLASKLLVIPKLIGSSSSSAVLLELLHAGIAPKALILGQSDAILPIGVIVSRQMGWPTIPMVIYPDPPFETGETLSLCQNGQIKRA